MQCEVCCIDNITQHARLWLLSTACYPWLYQHLAFILLFLLLHLCCQQINLCAGFGKQKRSKRRRDERTARRWPCVGDKRAPRFSQRVFVCRHSGDLWDSVELLAFRAILFAGEPLEPHISQNTSPRLKRHRCHSSGKKRRRIAVYRVAPLRRRSLLHVRAPFTHCWSVFVSMNALRKRWEWGSFSIVTVCRISSRLLSRGGRSLLKGFHSVMFSLIDAVIADIFYSKGGQKCDIWWSGSQYRIFFKPLFCDTQGVLVEKVSKCGFDLYEWPNWMVVCNLLLRRQIQF